MSERVGFIGVGFMGEGMAHNIVTKGYPLAVMAHRNREPVERLVAAGATEVTSAAEMAKQCSVIFLCVTGSPQVEALVLGADGILANAQPGTVIVDCSTSDPVSTGKLDAAARAVNMHFVDSPLGGTPKEAAIGALSAMVGADDDVFKRIQPVIATWAANITHLGKVGLGHTVKLVNNYVAMGYGAIYAEALALARKAGLSVEQFNAVIGSGRMRCGFYDTFMKWTIEGDPNAHLFTITNAHKDMRYASNLANDLGVVTPIQSLVRASFAAMDASGQGEKFVPMLADFVATANGLSATEERLKHPSKN